MATTLTNSLTFEGREVGYIFQPLLNPASAMSEFNVFPTVEGKVRVPKISSLRQTAQDGANCGWDPTSTITLSDAVFTCLPVKHNIEICKDDLKQTYAAKMFRMNDNEMDLTGTDVYDAILEICSQGFNRDMMDVIWWGSNNNGAPSHSDSAATAYLDWVDGLYFNINAGITLKKASDLANVTVTGTSALGTDEGLYILDGIYNSAPNTLKQVPKPLKRFYVTGSIYDNLEQSLTGTDTALTGLNFTPLDILNGVEALTFRGVPIIPDYTWDQVLSENSTSLPFAHAAFYTTPQNLGVATNVTMLEVTTKYDEFSEVMQIKARYNLDTNILHTELIEGFKSIA